MGRHSLGTKDRQEAISALHELDLLMAVENGRADKSLLQTDDNQILELQEGRELYEEYVRRPAVAGGPRSSTAKRYRAVLDKFLPFGRSRRLKFWNDVDRKILDAYAAWLEEEGYSYGTQYLELTTLKQVLKFFVAEDHLPSSCLFAYPMKKNKGTSTYCWRDEEVGAILQHCLDNDLEWLHAILLSLANTGMRISELA